MSLSPLLLSRLQFAWVIGWHILLPAFTVGLSAYIAVLEGLGLATGREFYPRLSQFWTRVFAVAFGMGVVTGVVMQPAIAQRWFSWPNLALLSPVPILTALLAWGEWRALGGRGHATPFLGALGLFLLSYLGIAISLWPMIVPWQFTLWQAASGPSTQAFLLLGTLFLLPVILMYTGWSYWVFRGKVRAEIGYH